MPTEAGWPLPDAIADHARRFYAEGGEPAPPRVAATVVLLRPAPDGFEVYAIRRAATMAFASGMYAFPGGGVDPADADASIGWAGPAPADWSARLGLPGPAAQAVVCAAVREVFEEAGVLLAGDADAAVVGDVSERQRANRSAQQPGGRHRGAERGDDVRVPEYEAARRALVKRELSLTALLRERGLALRSDLLAPWSRWVTPEFEPRRFDTYFFVAALPPAQRTRDVSGEADHTLWIRPAEALAAYEAGSIAMLPPTAVTLDELSGHPDVPAVLAAAAHRDAAQPVHPRLELPPDGPARLHLPG